MLKDSKGTFSSDHFGLVAILVESALPAALTGIAYLVSFGLNSQISILFQAIYGMTTVSLLFLICTSPGFHRCLQVLAPQLILLRVAKGRAWTKSMAANSHVTTVAFSGPTSITPSARPFDKGTLAEYQLDDMQSPSKRDFPVGSMDLESGGSYVHAV
jgi:hypothetical protein